MAIQDGIHLKIAELEDKIMEYQGYIDDINSNIDILTPKYDYYSTATNNNIRDYDMTSSDFLAGNEISTDISKMDTSYSISSGFIEEVSSHINDLYKIIQLLEELISECRSEIENLYEELNSISGGELG